ncbi:MAG: transporter substrate-binding domain-containing protein [Erysipelotrichaceae bacterium]|nr:transporter substrate-binding domain-containing protein [Erysipelotrichaceae bacterium]
MKRLLALLTLTLALTGCSAPADNSTNDDTARKTLKVGMECNYAPFNWTQVEDSDTAEPISSVDFCDGYDVVIAARIASELNMDVQIVKTDWDNLIPALNAKDIDLIIAGMTETPDRAEAVNFTKPYYESQMVAVVRANSELTGITSIQELSGYNVLGQLNTIYDEIIDQIEGVNHMVPQDSYPRMVLSLQAGEADAITAEMPVAQGVVAANPDLAIVTFAEGNGFVADTSVSVAVRKSDTDLLEQVQAVLDSITQEERNTMMQEATNRQPANE